MECTLEVEVGWRPEDMAHACVKLYKIIWTRSSVEGGASLWGSCSLAAVPNMACKRADSVLVE